MEIGEPNAILNVLDSNPISLRPVHILYLWALLNGQQIISMGHLKVYIHISSLLPSLILSPRNSNTNIVNICYFVCIYIHRSIFLSVYNSYLLVVWRILWCILSSLLSKYCGWKVLANYHYPIFLLQLYRYALQYPFSPSFVQSTHSSKLLSFVFPNMKMNMYRKRISWSFNNWS